MVELLFTPIPYLPFTVTPNDLLGPIGLAIWGLVRLMGTVVRTGFQGLKFRFGRVVRTVEPGFHPLFPGLEVVRQAPVRSRTLDLPPQRVTSKDGLVFLINANVTFHVEDLKRALIEISNLDQGLLDALAVAVHAVVGEATRTELASPHELDAALGQRLQAASTRWGVRIDEVGFTSITPVGASLRFAQLAPLVQTRLASLRALEGAGMPRATALAVLGARGTYTTRRQRLVRDEDSKRVDRRQRWHDKPVELPQGVAPRWLRWLVGATLAGLLLAMGTLLLALAGAL